MPLSDARHAAESNDPPLGLWARRHNVHLRHPLETFSAARPLQDQEQEEVPKTDDRILHTLFPDNFLSPSLVTDQISVDGNSLSVWDVVEGNRFTSIGNNRTKIHEIEAQLRNAGLRPNFDFSGQGNIVTISGGKEVYVDTIRNFIHSSSDIDRLLDFMEKRGWYSEDDKKIIISSGKRLIELQKV